ncbi:MAG: PLP-dependent transferase, partial [Gammaproteobacteria bacterium]|nr:PLP-dependent transferase [Gammaproteobacteria bacterium]
SISIREVSEHVKRRNDRALIVVDNTWATPLFQKPLQHGADISVSSATKFISGHSDVMGGFVSTNNDDLAERLRETRFYTGAILDPNSAWLLRRSLHTFPLRMREHVRTTREICTYLYTRKEIETVYFPETGKDQLIDYGGIVFVQLKEQYQNYYNDLKNHLHLFNTGTGMACVNSMIAQPWSGSHASLSDQEKREMGLNPGLIRLCFGLETLDDLTADLGQAFDRMSQRHLEEITAEEELSEFATYE